MRKLWVFGQREKWSFTLLSFDKFLGIHSVEYKKPLERFEEMNGICLRDVTLAVLRRACQGK